MACRTGLSDRLVSKKGTEERRVSLAVHHVMTSTTVTVTGWRHCAYRNVIPGRTQRISAVVTRRTQPCGINVRKRSA